MDLKMFLISLGVVAVVVAWFVIGLSWYLNRGWFVFMEDAYSDLGGYRSCCPWLFNYGLICVGILIILYGVGVVLVSANKLEVVGGSYLSLAGVFLVLIGLFPAGTRPHTFVSAWFFIQSDIALTILTYGLWRRTNDRSMLYGFIISLIAIPVAILVEIVIGWPSAAVIETYGILIIDLIVIMLYLEYRAKPFIYPSA